MTDRFDFLLSNAGISWLAGQAAAGDLFLAGGALRDLLLSRQVTDYDLVSPFDPTPLARKFSRHHDGHWFWLDQSRRQSRVLVNGTTYDFSPFRAATLPADLAARDFTINAMAIDLAGPLTADFLIDPLHGRTDLAAGILRHASPGVLHDDPLRILKGVRHVLDIDLAVDPETLQSMRSAARSLDVVAPERLRSECWRIFASPANRKGIALLAACGAGQVLFGPHYSRNLRQMECALQSVEDSLSVLSDNFSMVKGWLDNPVEAGLERGTLLKWCAILSQITPDLPLLLAHRWKFSIAARRRIKALLHQPQRLAGEIVRIPCRPRPVALWLLRNGPDPVDLLLSLGTVIRKIEELTPYLEALATLPDPRQVPSLLDGHWLREHLDMSGPETGRALARLRDAEINGEVTTPEDARRFMRSVLPE